MFEACGYMWVKHCNKPPIKKKVYTTYLYKSICGDLGDGLLLFKPRKKYVFPSLKFSLEGQKSQCFPCIPIDSTVS
jgi:hypothetical protein